MQNESKTTKIEDAVRIVIAHANARWESSDSEGDSCRAEHLNRLIENLQQEFGVEP